MTRAWLNPSEPDWPGRTQPRATACQGAACAVEPVTDAALPLDGLDIGAAHWLSAAQGFRPVSAPTLGPGDLSWLGRARRPARSSPGACDTKNQRGHRLGWARAITTSDLLEPVLRRQPSHGAARNARFSVSCGLSTRRPRGTAPSSPPTGSPQGLVWARTAEIADWIYAPPAVSGAEPAARCWDAVSSAGWRARPMRSPSCTLLQRLCNEGPSGAAGCVCKLHDVGVAYAQNELGRRLRRPVLP